MAVATFTYSKFGYNLATGKVSDFSLADSDFRVMLLADTYVPDQALHDNVSDISTHEIIGTGYVAGGAALADKQVVSDGLYTRFKAGNTEWSSSTFSARYAVVYDNTPALAADKKLIAYAVFDAVTSPENGTLRLEWNANGIAVLEAVAAV
jgi:hypothetical protein